MNVLKKVAGVLLVSVPLWCVIGFSVFLNGWHGTLVELWLLGRIALAVLALILCVKFGLDLLKSKEVEP